MPPMSTFAQVYIWLLVLWVIGLFFMRSPGLYLYLPILGPCALMVILTILDWLWKRIPHR